MELYDIIDVIHEKMEEVAGPVHIGFLKATAEIEKENFTLLFDFECEYDYEYDEIKEFSILSGYFQFGDFEVNMPKELITRIENLI